MVEKGKGGKIINISSVDAFHPSTALLAAYSTSKGAVVNFTRSLALELAPNGITVNAIAPGGILTEGLSNTVKEMGISEDQLKEIYVTKIVVGHMGTPEHIRKAAIFLASSASDYVTGQTVIADGGLLLT